MKINSVEISADLPKPKHIETPEAPTPSMTYKNTYKHANVNDHYQVHVAFKSSFKV